MSAQPTATLPFAADTLNAHLASDGVVQVTTYARSTLYSKKHAGWFTRDADGGLRVKSGRGSLYLGPESQPWVSIRTGRYAERAP